MHIVPRTLYTESQILAG